MQTQAEAGYPVIESAPSVTKAGVGGLAMDAVNGYAGPTTVAAGTLEVANSNGLAATAVTVVIGPTLGIASAVTRGLPRR